MSEAFSEEEVQDIFLKQCAALVFYWSKQSGTDYERCSGLMFSILSLIDGSSMALPAMDIVLRPHPEDRDYCKSIGEEWMEDGMAFNKDVALHELWSKYELKTR